MEKKERTDMTQGTVVIVDRTCYPHLEVYISTSPSVIMARCKIGLEVLGKTCINEASLIGIRSGKNGYGSLFFDAKTYDGISCINFCPRLYE